MTLLAMEEAIRALIEHFSGNTVPGWTSLMVVLCLSNASIMIAIGIVGEYIGRLYEEAKGRPLYVIADTFNVVRADDCEKPPKVREIATYREEHSTSVKEARP